MEKIQKKAKKSPKSKKREPLKVVYITNPIKFNASASEFRALVQELTGQDAATDAASFSPSSGGGAAVKVSVDGHVHAELEQEVNKLETGRPGGGVIEQNDDDSFVSSLMIEGFQEYAQTYVADLQCNRK